MKSVFLFAVMMTSVASAHDSVRCSDHLVQQLADVEQVTKLCLKEGLGHNFQYFPKWLPEKIYNCQVLNTTDSDAHLNCAKRVIRNARNLLTCNQSAQRYQETVKSDDLEFDNRYEKKFEVKVPAQVQERFELVTKAADRIFGHQFRAPVWSLRSYALDGVNATAGAGGRIAIHSNYWKEPTKYNLDEITAVLAHEAGHVVREHSLDLGCLALEWIDPEGSIVDITPIFREDLMSAGVRKDAWMKKSQSIEYEADRLAAVILQEIGLDPRLMKQVLIKMAPPSEGGFSSGSHPSLNERTGSLEAFIKELEKRKGK